MPEMYERVWFGCMFMIGFARFVKFCGILVAHWQRRKAERLNWQFGKRPHNALQWGKGAHLPELIFLPFLRICLASLPIALTLFKLEDEKGMTKKLNICATTK